MGGRHNAKNSEAPVADFDQTNGVVEGLEGDDGGAVDPEAERRDPFSELINGTLDDNAENENENGETRYSEEGTP